MCSSNSLVVLAENPRGYIGQCGDCKYFTVAYNNIFLILQADEYRDFGRVIRERLGVKRYTDSFMNGKSVLIPTPTTGLLFALTDAEFDELHSMLDRADCVQKTRQELRRFFLN